MPPSGASGICSPVSDLSYRTEELSYDISLCARGSDEPLRSPERFEEGGTYALGGTSECDLNVTYNYWVMFDFHALDGRTGADTVAALREFAERWKHDAVYKDYWAPTPGNVRSAVVRLLSFAEAHPDGVWHVR